MLDLSTSVQERCMAICAWHECERDVTRRRAIIQRLLEDSDSTIRSWAIFCCDSDVLQDATIRNEVWRKAIGATNTREKTEALRRLAVFGDDRIVDECESWFECGSRDQKVLATTLLGMLGTSTAAEHLAAKFSEARWSMKVEVASNLIKCGDFSKTWVLEEELRRISRWQRLPFLKKYRKWEKWSIIIALVAARSPIGLRHFDDLRKAATRAEWSFLNDFYRTFRQEPTLWQATSDERL